MGGVKGLSVALIVKGRRATSRRRGSSLAVSSISSGEK